MAKNKVVKTLVYVSWRYFILQNHFAQSDLDEIRRTCIELFKIEKNKRHNAKYFEMRMLTYATAHSICTMRKRKLNAKIIELKPSHIQGKQYIRINEADRLKRKANDPTAKLSYILDVLSSI